MRLFNKKKEESCLAYSDFVEQYLGTLYQTAYRLAASQAEAEYLVQNLFIKLQPNFKELQDSRQPLILLNKQLYRMFFDHRRHVNRESMSPILPLKAVGNRIDIFLPADALADSKSKAGMDELVLRLERGLDHLSEEDRSLVILYEVAGYDISDIQEITGMPYRTIQSKLLRARTQLREIVKQSIAL